MWGRVGVRIVWRLLQLQSEQYLAATQQQMLMVIGKGSRMQSSWMKRLTSMVRIWGKVVRAGVGGGLQLVTVSRVIRAMACSITHGNGK